MSGMKIEKDPIQSENLKLLMEIHNLKIKLRELYDQKGPSNHEYISLSIKLDLLKNEYIEEKIVNLIRFPKEDPMEIRKQEYAVTKKVRNTRMSSYSLPLQQFFTYYRKK